VLVLQLYPLPATLLHAFTDYNGIQFPPDFVGLSNFVQAFTQSPAFWTAVGNTV
jgi:multiple sugar transport system permease protein